MRENAALYTDDRAAAQAAVQGQADACRHLVQQHQDEVLRAAFLLTGRSRLAVELATGAFLDVFRRMQRSDPDREFRPWLLECLTHRFLAPADGSGGQSTGQGVPPAGTEAGQRYAVDNERTRLRAALTRLDPGTRVMLVLHEFGGLPLDTIARTLDANVEQVRSTVDAAGRRLRTSVGLADEPTLSAALRQAAVDAPRPDLWERIEEPLSLLNRREQRRARAINLGAFSAVCLGLIVAVALLFGGFGGILSGGDDGNQSAGAVAADETPPADPTATSTPTPEATPSGQPAALGPESLSVAGEPRADLPDTVLFARSEDGTVLYEPSLPLNTRRIPDPEGGDVREAGRPVISPDGRQVVMLYHVFAENRVSGVVAGYGPELEEMQWSVEVASAEYDGDGRPPFFLNATIDGERIYVSLHHWNSSQPVSILVLERSSGEERERIETTVPGFSANDLRLFAPPGHDTVYLFTIARDAPPLSGGMQILFLAFQVPGGEKVHGRILTDLADSRAFFVYGSTITPDGNGLYNVTYTHTRQQLAVHFFDLQRGVIAPLIRLPFQPLVDPLPYQHVVSHDGRQLFVLSPETREVAIVDLENRELVGIVPLDMGAFSGGSVNSVQFSPGNVYLSPDGSRMYAIGAARGVDAARSSGVWVIDTASWTLVDHWVPDARPDSLLLEGDGETLYIQETERQSIEARTDTLRAIDTQTGRERPVVVPNLGSFAMYSLAGIYRDQYGYTPDIDGRTPGSVPAPRPLARLTVSVDPETLSPGEQAIVDVRFVDPLTDEPVAEGAETVRYSPPASVRAIFTPEGGGDGVILDLGRASFGRYQGTIALPDAGSWSLRVVAGWSDGQPGEQALVINDAIEVQQTADLASETVTDSFAGLDGQQYQVRLTTIPSPPRAGQPVEMRAWFVDAETGARLPWETWLEGGLPREMAATLVMPEHSDEATFTLVRFGQGYFSGNVTFPSVGTAGVRVTFSLPDIGVLTVSAGETMVLSPA